MQMCVDVITYPMEIVRQVQRLRVEAMPMEIGSEKFVVRMYPPHSGYVAQVAYYTTILNLVRRTIGGSFMAWQRKVKSIRFSMAEDQHRESCGFFIETAEVCVDIRKTATRFADMHTDSIPRLLTRIKLFVRFADAMTALNFDKNFNLGVMDVFGDSIEFTLPYAYPTAFAPIVRRRTRGNPATGRLLIDTNMSWPRQRFHSPTPPPYLQAPPVLPCFKTLSFAHRSPPPPPSPAKFNLLQTTVL